MTATLQLDIVTPERLALSKEVNQVILPGSEGSLGVMPGHMNLVVDLHPGLLRCILENEEIVFAIGGGYAEITSRKVIVLAETAENADDINVEKAQQEQDRALHQLKQGVKGAQLEEVEISLKKAVARLRVVDFSRRRKTK
jgi:F-type H+-transporting ATPase subunit epsilon